MFISRYLPVYEELKLFIGTKMYINKDDIPTLWLMGFILKDFECKKR